MDEQCVAKRDPTITSLDSKLGELTARMEKVANNLNIGIWGNSTKCEDEDVKTMESPSLASIDRRINYIFGHLADVERLTNKIYSNTPVVG